jgi:hypothetical protein
LVIISKENNTKTGEIDISQEILFNIFEFIDHDKQFLDTIGMVNKEWYHLARHCVVWKTLKISSKFIELMPLKLLKSISNIILIDKWKADDLNYFAKYAKNIREFDISEMKGWKLLIRRIYKRKFPLLSRLNAGSLNVRDYVSYINEIYQANDIINFLN